MCGSRTIYFRSSGVHVDLLQAASHHTDDLRVLPPRAPRMLADERWRTFRLRLSTRSIDCSSIREGWVSRSRYCSRNAVRSIPPERICHTLLSVSRSHSWTPCISMRGTPDVEAARLSDGACCLPSARRIPPTRSKVAAISAKISTPSDSAI